MTAGEWRCNRDGCGAGFGDIAPEYEFGKADPYQQVGVAGPLLIFASCANGHAVNIEDASDRAQMFAADPEHDREKGGAA